MTPLPSLVPWLQVLLGPAVIQGQGLQGTCRRAEMIEGHLTNVSAAITVCLHLHLDYPAVSALRSRLLLSPIYILTRCAWETEASAAKILSTRCSGSPVTRHPSQPSDMGHRRSPVS